MSDGWIKLHRKILENPVVCKDADYLAVWIYLLLKATHDEIQMIFRGEKIRLRPGQLITGRMKIASDLSVNESKVKRILIAFKNDQQIDQQTSNKNSLITILNWDVYQKNDQQDGQQMPSECPADAQQVTTNKNVKNDKNERKDNMSPEYPYKDVIAYLNQRAGTAFRDSSKDSKKHIIVRFAEGFTLDDFKAVIDKKVLEWDHEPKAGEKDMRPYIRPATLFGSNFESYLNQKKPNNVTSVHESSNKFNNFHQRTYDYGKLEAELLKSQEGK